MVKTQELLKINEQEYLAGELISEIKHEYIDGIPYAMAGASKNHQRITGNLFSALLIHLKNTPCDVFASDIKVKAGRNFFYPDIIIACEDKTDDEYYTESPSLIVEVLSKSTRKTDHSLKRLAYQNLRSLQEYVLIEQDFVDIEVCRRNRHWQSEHYFLGDEVYFSSLELHIPVADIYTRVKNDDMQAFAIQQSPLKPD